MPGVPGLLTATGGVVEPVVLAEVGQRMDAEPKAIVVHRMRQAKQQRSALVEQCQEQPDGTCPLTHCPCGKAQAV